MDYRYEDKIIRFIDTAGLRKKSRIKYGVDYFSSMRTIDSIDRADIIILMLDASQEFSEQDQKIASYAQRKFKNMIILLNKWDLIEDKETNTYKEYVQKYVENLRFLSMFQLCQFPLLQGNE